MNNKIEWNKYADHIFCLHYLPNNRLNSISKTLTDIGINIYDSKYFSFIYDYDHGVFKNELHNIIEKTFNLCNQKSYFVNALLNINTQKYVFYIALNIYRTLKIAQCFNYDRIILFEDDIVFLKDINYIINAMNFIKTQDFDVCLCQTTFIEAWHGIKSYLVNYGCEDLGNDMFLKTNIPSGVYGAAFNIIAKSGINKLINFIESTNLLVALDTYDTVRNLIDLNTIFALKPLCIQRDMIQWSEERRKDENINININEYNNE